MAIDKFEGNHRFLSNFYPAQVEWEGLTYPSVEHAYQAAKSFDSEYRLKCQKAKDAKVVKGYGKRAKLRADWEDVKLDIMTLLVTRKFMGDKVLGDLLIATGDEELIEGNWWGDTIWGVCKGVGQNLLGKILMVVRQGLKDGKHTLKSIEGDKD